MALRLGMRRAVMALAHRLCRVLYAILRDKAVFDASRLTAHEARTVIASPRVYRPTPRPGRTVTNEERDRMPQLLPRIEWMTPPLNAERNSSGYRLGRHPLT
jgi:hypothetical protein